MKTTLSIIGGLFALIILGWVLQANDYINFKFWAPKYEDARRNIFENTQSYVQGKIQDLSNYKLQYDKDTSMSDKEAIKSVIQSQFANFDISKCPDGLKPFLQECRGY
ncbi:MAG: hypothetical protein ACTHJ8_10575 [Mucilaginibacter sp.]